MEGFILPVEAIFEERAKHSVLLVGAVEEGTNVTSPAVIASCKLHGMTLGCHISPLYIVDMRRKARSRTAYQMFTAITVRRNAPRTLKYPRRRSANSSAIAMRISARTQRGTTGREIDSEGAVMRHGSPRLDRVRSQFRNRPSEGKDDTAEASIRPGSGVMCFGSMILSPLNSNVKMSP